MPISGWTGLTHDPSTGALLVRDPTSNPAAPEQVATVEEAEFTWTYNGTLTPATSPFGLAGTGWAANEAIFPVKPMLVPCRLTAFSFVLSAATTNLTGSVYWSFRPQRHRCRRVDVSTNPTVTTSFPLTNAGNTQLQTTNIQAYEGIQSEISTFDRSITFIQGDVLALRVAYAGVPSNLVFPAFTFRTEPL